MCRGTHDRACVGALQAVTSVCNDGSVTTSPVEVEPDVDSDAAVEPALPWMTVVWDDPVNLMSYVTFVFQNYFKYSRDKAEDLMLEVHNDGRAVVSSGSREKMERDVQAMHEYGLWATMERDA